MHPSITGKHAITGMQTFFLKLCYGVHGISQH